MTTTKLRKTSEISKPPWNPCANGCTTIVATMASNSTRYLRACSLFKKAFFIDRPAYQIPVC